MNCKFYSHITSSSSFRVRIAANILGIELDIIPVDLLKAENEKDEYLKINPLGKVPALIYVTNSGEARSIEDSSAIIDFFMNRTRSLYPEDLDERAAVLSMVNNICDIQTASNTMKHPPLDYRLERDVDKVRDGHNPIVKERLTSFEKLLEAKRKQFNKEDCKFSFADEPGILDIYVVPQVFNLIRYTEKYGEQDILRNYPVLRAIYENCMEIDSFSLAHPNHPLMLEKYHVEEKHVDKIKRESCTDVGCGIM